MSVVVEHNSQHFGVADGRDQPIKEGIKKGRVPTPRIAIIRQKYSHDGGAERFVSSMMRVLHQQPYELTLITRQWNSDCQVPVVRCNPPRWGRLLRDWGFARSAVRAVRRHEFDLVQSHERIASGKIPDVYRAGDGVHREWLRQRGRVQPWFLWALTPIDPYHAYVKRTEKKLFESVHLKAVICNSKMVRDDVLRYFSIDEKKLRVIYTGVDIQRFHPDVKQYRDEVRGQLSIPKNALTFTFVGSGFVRKGLAVSIRALAQVPDTYLLVIGRDKHMSRFQRLAHVEQVADRVRFLGVQEDVSRFHGAADGMLFPTLYDPLPNALLEALACGLPVITSTTCGGAELIMNGKCGYVHDALDVVRVAEAIRRFANVEDRKLMSKRARRTIEPYTLEMMRDKLSQFYVELLQ